MTEDTRVCPVCKKYPPQGQVWKDFEAHKRQCGLAKEHVDELTDEQVNDFWNRIEEARKIFEIS